MRAAGLALLTGLLAHGGAAAADGVTFAAPAGAAVTLTTAQLEKLPSTPINVSFGTDHGILHAGFAGPLLWTVLSAAHALPPNPKDIVRDAVVITGSDGYVATLALGEISSAFENKTVILADQMNGKLLGASHWRLIVPGEVKGGRSVRDVVRIVVVRLDGG